MPSVTHLVLASVGAFIGARLASENSWLFAAVIGACAGVGIAEAVLLARRVKILEVEIDRLRGLVSREREQPAEPPSMRARTPESPARAHPIAHEVPPAVAAPIPAQSLSPAALHSAPQATHTTRPMEPREPVPESPIVIAVRHFFSGGNALVRVGIVVLFFGVAFLLRYLAEHTHIPVEFRLTGVAVGALVLLVIGWRLRARRSGYALALQGGAVGILYLTVFAALRLYALLSPATTFPLLVLLAGVSAALAVLQSSPAFALLAATGGFLAPILASSGHGSHVVLFSYYAILNAAILATAWFKAWRPLNLAGFLFTFVIATLWGVLHYRPEDFATTEPFLVLFFLFYVAIAVLFTLRQPSELRGYVDATLVFGTPIAAFGLQAAMLHDRLLPLAYSAVAVSGVYLLIAWLLHHRQSPMQRLLVEAFLALGVAFVTLAVPLALNGSWSAATWAVEGAALIWIGGRQSRPLARAVGVVLQLAAGCIIWLNLQVSGDQLVLPAGMSMSGLLVGAAAIFAVHTLDANRERLREYERLILIVLFFWGLIWWCVSGLSELQRRVAPVFAPAAELGYATLTALVSSQLHQRFKLAVARVPALLLLPVMLLAAVGAAISASHPLANGGWVCWPVAFVAFYVLARRHEGLPAGGLAQSLHAVSAWLLGALLSWELAWQVHHAVDAGGSWSGIAWAVMPAVLLFLIPQLTAGVAWPFGQHRKIYLTTVASGFAVYLALWTILANVLLRGDSYPLPYVPVLNPLDLAQAFVLLALIRHFLVLRRDIHAQTPLHEAPVLGALALLAFIALTGALLRTLNHWAGVPFSLDTMLQSTLVQTSLSIFWALLALTTMLVATRGGHRAVWIAGAGLLTIVVIKLFLVDLSSIGSIERIVSFVGVGMTMLVLGYFSPLPPVAKDRP
jgi:uncharacterized membrane protein